MSKWKLRISFVVAMGISFALGGILTTGLLADDGSVEARGELTWEVRFRDNHTPVQEFLNKAPRAKVAVITSAGTHEGDRRFLVAKGY